MPVSVAPWWRVVFMAGWVPLAGAAAVTETDAFMANVEKGSHAPNLEKGNWVVAPIPVSNPTMGTGLQLATLYLHPSRDGNGGPNPTSGLGAMYTDTDSWVVGAFHQDYLLDDRLRVTAAAGTGSLKLKYYGFGGEGFFANNPLDYTIDMAMGFARAQWRLPQSDHWFLGPALIYSDGDVEMEFDQRISGLPGLSKNIAVGGAGMVLTYDSRDNNYFPTQGINFSASYFDFAEALGSDFDFGKTRLDLSYYKQLFPDLVLATNGAWESTSGRAPFFNQASAGVRGYNRGEYMDDDALKASIEGRYSILPRWVWVGFYDYGWVNDGDEPIFQGKTAHSIGTGLRWQTTPSKPLHIGVDVAFTDDDTVFFIQLGESF